MAPSWCVRTGTWHGAAWAFLPARMRRCKEGAHTGSCQRLRARQRCFSSGRLSVSWTCPLQTAERLKLQGAGMKALRPRAPLE